ncbi:hypothetical protein [Wolbachia endosymbiont (group A) of Apoderus coryli]|nr:hypothetical protein [Wolbachia endosymbiont (group A) of Apoderus coryli]
MLCNHGNHRRVSSQCLTLGSRNFIKLVSIKVAVLCKNTTF